ncbi:MAG: hypothetical protein ACRDNS_34355 [Trebonia sp.]
MTTRPGPEPDDAELSAPDPGGVAAPATAEASSLRPADPGSSGRHSRLLAAGGAAVVAVALVVIGALELVSVRDTGSRSAQRAAALSAARHEVVAFTTLSNATAANDIKTLLAGATSGFRAQLAKQAQGFQQAVRDGKVTSTGRVDSAGLVTLSGNTAVAIVAATAKITNTKAPAGARRQYRFSLTLKQVDGRWLVSDLGFVR